MFLPLVIQSLYKCLVDLEENEPLWIEKVYEMRSKVDEVSFWFDNWSHHGRLIAITGQRDCIDVGITLHATLAEAVVSNRRRPHRIETLNQMETALEDICSKGLIEAEDIVHFEREREIISKQISAQKRLGKLLEKQSQR